MRSLVVITWLVLCCGSARADDAEADRLVAEGARAGAARRYQEAIDRFKAAAALRSRPSDDCNIGSMYLELGRHGQAQLFLERCRSRAPGRRERAFAEAGLVEAMRGLRRAGAAPIALAATPVGTKIAISTFAADELVAPPITVWLLPGAHTLTASLAGHETQSRELAVDGKPQQVAFELKPPPPAPEPEPAPEPAPEPPRDPPPVIQQSGGPVLTEIRRTSWGPRFLIGGGVVAAAGGVFHVIAWRTRERAAELPPGAAYDDAVGRLGWQRGLTIGLYGGAAALLVTGAILLVVRPSARLAVGPGGTSFWVQGRF